MHEPKEYAPPLREAANGQLKKAGTTLSRLLHKKGHACQPYLGLVRTAIMAAAFNLKGIVLAGLMQAQNLIRLIGGPGSIDPQFRIMTPEGDFLISMALAGDHDERMRQLQHVSMFMAWKMAVVFTVAGELIDPDAVYCCGATRDERIAAISAIERNPVRFGSPEWLAPDSAADEIAALLPQGKVLLDPAGIAELDAYFGARGKFPAVRLGDGAAQDFVT